MGRDRSEAGLTRARRFHVPGLDVASARVRLPPSEAHHASHVLRLSPGAEVELFDGRGRAVLARIRAVEGNDVDVEIEETLVSVDSPLDLSVALAVPKSDRMDFAVEKLTELGVRRILPLEAERSIELARLEKRLERWRRIAIEATKQSGRSLVPVVSEVQSLDDCLRDPTSGAILLAHPGRPFLEASELRAAAPEAVTAVIGPEGGFTDEELALGRDSGALTFGLGPRVLRTETAAVAAAVLLQAALGDTPLR